MIDLGAYHPELAALGAAAAGGAWLIRRRLPVHPADAAVLVGAAWLTATDQLPPLAAVGLALVAVGSALGGLGRRPRARPDDDRADRADPRRAPSWRAAPHAATAAGAIALVVARTGLPLGARGLLAVALLVALWPPQPAEPMAGRVTRALILPGALAATFLGGPDTEAAVAWGAAAAVALVVACLGEVDGPGPSVTWAAAAFVAVDAYRGRTAGLPAAIVVVGGLLALRLAQRPRDLRAAMNGASVTARIPLAALAIIAVGTMAGAARTMGLATAAGWRDAVVGGVLGLALAGLGWLSEAPLPVGRHRG
jgi:hypothetical protein